MKSWLIDNGWCTEADFRAKDWIAVVLLLLGMYGLYLLWPLIAIAIEWVSYAVLFVLCPFGLACWLLLKMGVVR